MLDPLRGNLLLLPAEPDTGGDSIGEKAPGDPYPDEQDHRNGPKKRHIPAEGFKGLFAKDFR